MKPELGPSIGMLLEERRRMREVPADLSTSPKTLPMLPVRPGPKMLQVDPQWKCQNSGDCCTKPREVVMTKLEAAELVHHAPPEITMHFRTVDERFVALKAGPCPLYVFKTCLVYDHRPYNCRRFGCMRPDVKSEPFAADGSNMMDRVKTSRVARRMAETMQRHAQRWARKFGWMEEQHGRDS